MEVTLGAMEPKLAEQLSHLPIPAHEVLVLQLDADAISRLLLRGVITEREALAARKRLMAAIKKTIKEHRP